jgi:hypothetical protein
MARSLVTLQAGSEWPDIEIILTPGSRIEGRVTGAEGAVVAGARVEVRLFSAVELPGRFQEIKALLPPPRGKVAFTGKDGGYRIEPLAGGLYEIEVAAPDHAWKVIEAYSVSDPVHRLDLELDAGRAIAGRVVDDLGQTIAGAEVLAMARSSSDRSRAEILDVLGTGGARIASTKTGAEGHFELVRLPATSVILAALAPGFQPAFLDADDLLERIDMVLLRNARISGRAFDAATGAPVPRFQVRIDPLESSTVDGVPSPGRTERGLEATDGVFAIDDMAPGTYEIRLSSPEHATFRKRAFLQPGGEAVVDARMESGERLEGVVKARTTNAAVAGATLALRHAVPAGSPSEPWMKEKSIQSGKEGEFAIEGLDAGEYELLVQHSDYFLDAEERRLLVTLPRDEAAPLEVVLSPAGRLSVKLRSARQLDSNADRFFFALAELEEGGGSDRNAGRKAAAPSSGSGAKLQPFDVYERRLAAKGRVEPHGSFKAFGLRPGRYQLTIHAAPPAGGLDGREQAPGEPSLVQRPGDVPPAATTEVELRPGETTEVELEVP